MKYRTIDPKTDGSYYILFMCSIALVSLSAFAVKFLADIPTVKQFGLSPLVIGLLLAMVFANIIKQPSDQGWVDGLNFSARTLLRLAVAFYGLNISVQAIVQMGLNGFFLALTMVVSTLLLGLWLGTKVFNLDIETTLLTAIGSAVCGAAAVLALEATLKSETHKSSTAIASVVLFGSLSLLLYPLLYHSGWGALGTDGFGMYIGASVHEVAQVIATASSIDQSTTDIATIVKMSRVALLIPCLLVLSILIGRRTIKNTDARHLPIPWFVFGFVVCAAINSTFSLPVLIQDTFKLGNAFLLSMSMIAIGLQTRWQQVRAAGSKVLLLGLGLYLWLLLGGYGLTRLFNV